MGRPRSIAEIARRAITTGNSFDPSVREFLDSWQLMDSGQRMAALEEEPVSIGAIPDAYIAALAEHLALMESGVGPAWSERPTRFLKEPFFPGGLESLKAILLVESPLAFRRRLIFISNDGLSRPVRRMTEDNVATNRL